VILEQAYNEASAKLKPLSFNSIAFLVRVFFIGLITGGCYLFFGYSIVLLLSCTILALLISRVIITEINTALLTKSLKKIPLKK